MADFFFYGTLCHPPLLRAVLGRDIATAPARLPGHAVYWAAGQAFPLIVAEPGAAAEGLVARDLTEADVARLDFYEGGFAYATRLVDLADGAAPAAVYFPDPGFWEPGPRWSLADWVARHGATVTATAADFMALFGQKPAAAVLRRYPMMLVRGASRLRAAVPGPATLRRAPGPGDIVIEARREPYAHFFAVEEYDLRHRLFDGGMSACITRATFVSGDAATVLPYDPVRDRVLVIEQFRAGPLARGDANPWLLEPVAGRVDPDETPEQAARREAQEEAGVTLGRMIPVAEYYPSPGAKTEYLYSYVGIADLPDGAAGSGGVASEHEDIRAHVIPFDRLMDLVAGGEGANGPLILTALWLAANRAALRAGG